VHFTAGLPPHPPRPCAAAPPPRRRRHRAPASPRAPRPPSEPRGCLHVPDPPCATPRRRDLVHEAAHEAAHEAPCSLEPAPGPRPPAARRAGARPACQRARRGPRAPQRARGAARAVPRRRGARTAPVRAPHSRPGPVPPAAPRRAPQTGVRPRRGLPAQPARVSPTSAAGRGGAQKALFRRACAVLGSGVGRTKRSPGEVKSGTAAQSASTAVVCALNAGESRNRSPRQSCSM